MPIAFRSLRVNMILDWYTFFGASNAKYTEDRNVHSALQGETLLQADLEVLPAAQYWLQVSELQPHMCVSLEDTQPVVEVRTATAELMEGDAVEQVWCLFSYMPYARAMAR